MGFFTRKNKTEVPGWASFFSADEYTRFMQELEAYFKSLDLSYKQSDGVVRMQDTRFGATQLGLVNVAQLCKLGDGNYGQIIRDHFRSMEKASAFDDEFQRIVTDYEQAKKYLAVRLYGKDYADSMHADMRLGKPVGDDLYGMLVFDLPDSITNVLPRHAEDWGQSFDALFETGLQNVRNNYEIDLSEKTFGEFSIWLAQANHFFAGNIVFDLDKTPELQGVHGSLVCVPHRHAVIIYPINDTGVLQAINGLIPTVYGMHQEGPGSISNHLFWYRRHELESLPYTVADERISFTPTPGFVEMLNYLADSN